jgi:hypothetical protein
VQLVQVLTLLLFFSCRSLEVSLEFLYRNDISVAESEEEISKKINERSAGQMQFGYFFFLWLIFFLLLGLTFFYFLFSFFVEFSFPSSLLHKRNSNKELHLKLLH